MSGRLRIIGGQWRSRIIGFDDAPGLRPTPARVRETLFNWLQTDIHNSRCLDLFAGSGALGFEAASRGAQQVVLIESNPLSCQKLRENCLNLGASQIQVLHQDVQVFLGACQDAFDVIFLDPPFGQDWVQPICQQLNQRGLLAPHGKIYIETERNLSLQHLPAEWQLLKDKVAGEVSFRLYQNP